MLGAAGEGGQKLGRICRGAEEKGDSTVDLENVEHYRRRQSDRLTENLP
jgi:hypothetical protein